MLDAVRYLVVWNPLILILLHYGLHFFGLERRIHHRGPHPLGPANSTALNGTALNGTVASVLNSTLQEALNATLSNGTLLDVMAQAAGRDGARARVQ